MMSTSGRDGTLTPTECAHALRSVPTGRLLYTEDALPAVRLVTFAAPHSEIIIATENEVWFDRLDRTFVAFEPATSSREPVPDGAWSFSATPAPPQARSICQRSTTRASPRGRSSPLMVTSSSTSSTSRGDG